ncbi:hypothetical protein ACLEJQ_04940 [Pseudomonas sp. SMV71]|uniref:hypothetical protein n=1 Tax=unclassified Pseudomonas TaxID=196821 RepID=UPI003F85AA64
MTETVKKPLSEQAIRNLELQIPDVAAGATHAAFFRALAAGHAVLKVEGNQIVESKADGSVRVVGEAKPRRKVTVGEVVKVRCINASA